ncbi:hypothetical protein [Micromonospora pisi]|nr:hypothetical protein [Micromonospora pisi]
MPPGAPADLTGIRPGAARGAARAVQRLVQAEPLAGIAEPVA